MIAQKNVTHLMVVDGVAAGLTTETAEDLTVGQVGIRPLGEQLFADATGAISTGKHEFVQKRQDGSIFKSPVIDMAKVTAKKVAYTAPTQRIRYVGYNGTSGSIDAENSTNYLLTIKHKFTFKVHNQYTYNKYGEYESDASGTQQEIVDALVANITNNYKKEVDKLVRVERVCDEAGTAVPTGNVAFNVTYGSPYITSTNVDDATGATAIAVGDYIRFDEVAAGTGTATTDPCYKVTAIDAVNNIITLDQPWQGATASIDDEDAELILAAAAASAEWGLKLTGVAPSNYTLGNNRYEVVDFDVVLNDGFGSTPTSTSQTPSRGAGTYQEVAELEWFLQGNRGEAYRVDPNRIVDIPKDVLANKTYDWISLEYSDEAEVNLGAKYSHPQVLMLAIENDTEGTSGSTLYTNLQTVFGI